LDNPEITQLTNGGKFEIAHKCEQCQIHYSEHYFLEGPSDFLAVVANIMSDLDKLFFAQLDSQDYMRDQGMLSDE
jgi:hypothetical protein